MKISIYKECAVLSIVQDRIKQSAHSRLAVLAKLLSLVSKHKLRREISAQKLKQMLSKFALRV